MDAAADSRPPVRAPRLLENFAPFERMAVSRRECSAGCGIAALACELWPGAGIGNARGGGVSLLVSTRLGCPQAGFSYEYRIPNLLTISPDVPLCLVSWHPLLPDGKKAEPHRKTLVSGMLVVSPDSLGRVSGQSLASPQVPSTPTVRSVERVASQTVKGPDHLAYRSWKIQRHSAVQSWLEMQEMAFLGLPHVSSELTFILLPPCLPFLPCIRIAVTGSSSKFLWIETNGVQSLKKQSWRTPTPALLLFNPGYTSSLASRSETRSKAGTISRQY